MRQHSRILPGERQKVGGSSASERRELHYAGMNAPSQRMESRDDKQGGITPTFRRDRRKQDRNAVRLGPVEFWIIVGKRDRLDPVLTKCNECLSSQTPRAEKDYLSACFC